MTDRQKRIVRDGREVCFDCYRYPDYWTWSFTRRDFDE